MDTVPHIERVKVTDCDTQFEILIHAHTRTPCPTVAGTRFPITRTRV